MKKPKTNYKQRYEELLIQSHTKKYIHIPFSWGGIGRFFVLLGSIGLTLFNFFMTLIPNWGMLHINELFKPGDEINKALIGAYQFGIVPQILFQYCLIGLCFISLFALIEGGFNKLNFKDYYGLTTGLISGLIIGSSSGLIAGLIGGLIYGLIAGLIYGLIVGLIAGLIGGLIVGLIAGLVYGLIYGLIGGLIGGLIVGLIYGLIYGLSDKKK